MKKTTITFLFILSGIVLGILLPIYLFSLGANFLIKGCNEDNKGGMCSIVGSMKIMDDNYSDSIKYFEKGCLLGEEQSCNILAANSYSGLNGYSNKVFSYALFDNACSLGHEKSCLEKKFMTGEDNDIKDLVENCDKEKHTLSCKKAGEYFFYGKNDAASDNEKAIKFLTSACSQLKDVSCYLLSIAGSETGNVILAQKAFDDANLQFPVINRNVEMKIKASFLLGNNKKTRDIIIKETGVRPYLAIWILKDPILRKTAEDKVLKEHYLTLLENLKAKNKEYLKLLGGVQ